MFGFLLTVIALAPGAATVGEPVTRSFNRVTYSEEFCDKHFRKFCQDRGDKRLEVAVGPYYIYDLGGELWVIFNAEEGAERTFTSYKDISSKPDLQAAIFKLYYSRNQIRSRIAVDNLDDLYAATRYMRKRAELIFGPIKKRCRVKRSPSGFPLSSNCSSEP